MPRHQQALAIAAFVIIIAALSYLAIRHNNAVGNQSGETNTTIPDKQYVNTTYGYSFSYPPQYAIDEYTPEYVSLTDPNTENSQTIVNINVVRAETGDTSKDFESFLYNRAESFCAADGPNGSLRCMGLSSTRPFSSANGLPGEEFYLTEIATDKSGSATTSVLGPFFAYDLSANMQRHAYTALLIFPSISITGAGPDAAVARTVADSVEVTAVSR